MEVPPLEDNASPARYSTKDVPELEIKEFMRGGLPSTLAGGKLRKFLVVVAIGCFFAGYNLVIFFDVLLFKDYLCSPNVYDCVGSSSTSETGLMAASVFNFVRASSSIVFIVSLIIGGAISDDIRTKYGNRLPMILIGSFIAGLGYIFSPVAYFTLADFISPLFIHSIMYSLISVGLGMSIGPELSLLSGLFSKEERGLAGLGLVSMGTIGSFIGLLVKWFLVDPHYNQPNQIPWLAVWCCFGLLLILSGVLTFVFTPKINPPFPPDSTIKDILATPRYLFSLGEGNETKKDFHLMLIVSILWGGAGFIITSNFPNFIGELRMSAFTNYDPAFLVLLMGIGGALFAGIAGLIVIKLGKARGGILGSVTLGIFAVLLAQSLVWEDTLLFAVTLLGGAGTVLLSTINLSLPADLVPRGKEGQFLGITSSVGNLLNPFVSFGVGMMFAYSSDILGGYSIVFMFAGCLYLLSIFFLFLVHYEERSDKEYRSFYRRYLKFRGVVSSHRNGNTKKGS